MKSNILIKGLAVVTVAVLLVVILKGRQQQGVSGDASNINEEVSGLLAIESGPLTEDNGLISEFLDDEFLKDKYGVDVDSPVETMRTLTNETRAVREDSLQLQDENRKQRQEIERLLKMEQSLKRQLEDRFVVAERSADQKRKELESTQNFTKSLISKLEQKLDTIQEGSKEKGGNRSASGYDIGAAGIPSGLGYDENGNPIDFDQVIWTNPIDASVDSRDPSKISLPDFTLATTKTIEKKWNEKNKDKAKSLIKAYTIPENATLLGSVTMTAMLGRIPSNGQVVDPYPFKVLVGEENLSSNGIHIPDVVGIKMSGIAKGDWTLSCVSGQIMSMTFTFRDGTILTIPESGTKTKEPLAWFSDKNGIPCVTGTRITNAASYLTQRVSLSTASSYANAEAASQLTTQTNASGLTSAVTGDPKIVAKNTAIADGLNEVTDWLDARQANSFDAIFVEPGTELAIHINQELKIDYDTEGRKVNHYANINRHSDTHID